jgi:hypothetical protein
MLIYQKSIQSRRAYVNNEISSDIYRSQGWKEKADNGSEEDKNRGRNSAAKISLSNSIPLVDAIVATTSSLRAVILY